MASHSSASHVRPSHQYPLDCHGPLTSARSNRPPCQKRSDGVPFFKDTRTGCAGRNLRSARQDGFDVDEPIARTLGRKVVIVTSSSRWLLRSSGAPTLPPSHKDVHVHSIAVIFV